MAGSVCKRWRSIVQMVHDKAWKSVTKAVPLKPKLNGPKFKKIGRVENEHTWNICECINIARDFVFYDDIELLEADLKELEKFSKPKKPGRKQLIMCRIQKLNEAETFNRLFAAGMMIFLGNMVSVDFKGQLINWSIVNKTDR